MANKLDREKATVGKMIHMYCHGHSHVIAKDKLCSECSKLLNYATERLTKCPHENNKPTCRKCSIHCYNMEMKAQIREVMRWSGKRMILYHPIDAIRHLLCI